ncbi:MAG: T9SS type A sorting domain-containing protein [Candidatus Eisenbacteria bacterium]|uniref:T9SS type A sorting domain-containing protein n=1 Tax=Eiseniibacteriota bacterium TaxID=2212470 RepID=A0A538UA75_UNCEI|nr:MAG: T9SS type A sorting domain-containing protein [Candidatus Eisenbacteria bacterium]
MADDDDGNLDDGTPHMNQIAAAFGAHGIGTGMFISMGHVALEDQPTPSPYAIQAQISYSGPIGGVDPASPRVFYSVNGSPFGSVPLTSSGGNDYTASIPAPARSIVRYYLKVSDLYGDSRTLPSDSSQPIAFLAGPTTTYLLHDFEADDGWIAGDPSDDATTGRWEWVVPQGSFVGNEPVQPGADHTPTGILCWVTQNPRGPSSSPGDFDVDNGHTTLFSAAFNALEAGPDPLVEYYRWYTNDLGSAPATDVWRVDLSNDGGGSWHSVESTPQSDNSWKRIVFFVKDVVPPSANMRLRFIAADTGQPSLVEAAVDDFRLLEFNAGVTAVGDASATELAFLPPAPNPASGRTRFSFRLPSRGAASLAIFDVSGRRVRALATGLMEAGPHEATWDGRDEAGTMVSSGLYFARLETPTGTLTRRVVRSSVGTDVGIWAMPSFLRRSLLRLTTVFAIVVPWSAAATQSDAQCALVATRCMPTAVATP